MRTLHMSWALSFIVASVGLSGCAAPAEEDNAEDQTSNVTGGSGAIESPVVYLFETDRAAAPKCAGAMLADTIAVTAKACAKVGLILGRATDKDGRGERARVKAVHTPEGADADIAVVELDKALEGTHAVITHMPLRDGYAVNGMADKDGSIPIISPDKGEASSVQATMLEESVTHGSILPKKGSEICAGDVGAPVCSSTGLKVPVLGYNIAGTCGLSGLVVGPMDAPATSTAPGATDATAPAGNGCSGKAWKVSQLGRHAEFLKKYAPKAFEPLRIDRPIIRNYAFVPDGLWGYKTKGDVKTCKIETPKLDAVAVSAASQKITAKVSFAGMEKYATGWGRFGIALKSEPTKMRWLPAKALGATRGAAYEATFEGLVSADKAGDYIVAFRASANGGETWTSCDTDGIANGFQIDKALALKVADATTPTPPGGTPPGGTTPQDQPPGQSEEAPYSDPPPSDDSASEPSGSGDPFAEEDAPKAKKKDSENGGCSVSSSGGAGASALPIAGVLLGLAALTRRRRAR
jgi:MYXO-CTERM domain-containing protein